MPDVQLPLLPQYEPHKEHSNNGTGTNEGATHSHQGHVTYVVLYTGKS